MKMFLEVKRVPANYPTRRGLAKATRYRPRSRLTFQVKKTKVTDIGNNLETEQNSPLRVGIYWKFNIYLTDRIGCLGCYPCMGVYHPSGQTTIFAQGVIAFGIRAQRKKGLVHFQLCQPPSGILGVNCLPIKHRCLYILLQVMQYMHDEIRKL